MKRILLVFSICLAQVFGQDAVNVPSRPIGLPIAYLTRLKFEGSLRQLSPRDSHNLCHLLVRSYVVSIRSYHQDYLLKTDCSVFRVLRENFPGVEVRVGEGGIFLSEITRFFNTLPEYRPDVEAVLREGVLNKCRD